MTYYYKIALYGICILFLSYLIIGSNYVYGQGEIQNNNQTFLAYEASYPVGYTIRYPSDWIYSEPEANWVSFFRGNFNVKDGFTNTSNVNVILDAAIAYKNLPLEIYSQLAIERSKTDHPGFEILSTNNTEIGTQKIPAYQIIYERAGYLDQKMNGTIFYFVNSPNAYYISYVAPIQDFAKNLPIAKQMIQSFKFTN